MPRRKTPEQYVKECKDNGYDLPIEDYKGNKVKINHKCKYGHIYSQTPDNHLSGHGCSYCSKKHKHTPKEYYDLCKEKNLDLPVESYKNKSTKIAYRCLIHNEIYKQTPASHYKSLGCSKCIHEAIKKGLLTKPINYLNKCKKYHLDPPVEDYINSNTKINHKCSRGHIYPQTPHDHLSGCGCPTCNGTPRKTTEQYIKECKEKHLDLPIGDYKNTSTKIKHICSKGHTYYQTPNNHLYGYGCPTCNESHGEQYIREYLDKNNIPYIPQKTFKDLKDKTYLSYDFYLPDYGILIEYQGIQHFESVSFNGKDNTDLGKQQRHDRLKKEYAKKNGYKLLELHYSLDTQEKVNKYLSRRIKD